MASWPALLDALEERTRRVAELVAGGAAAGYAALEDVELQAPGPLPPELAVRARVLLAETHRLEHELARRTGPAARAGAQYASN